jgi:hypothetical protein
MSVYVVRSASRILPRSDPVYVRGDSCRKLRGPDGKHLMAEEQLAVEEVVDAVQAAYDLLRHDLQALDGSVHLEAGRDEGVVNNIQVPIFRHSVARYKLLDCRSVDKRD